MRMAAYAGTSTVLATGIVLRAFHQRANFYSAAVYLAQSNACLMILTNLLLLMVCTLMLGLQRLLYGPLRPIEVEQLYEKAWFAITETCLAMTIFREEVGGWFLVMFVGLLVGKVWGWIGEGRVEILEQQPPANPRLFHARLSFSLLLSLSFDFWVLGFAIRTVLRQARPNMMVMFAFEFAVLSISSTSTAARYAISLYEAAMIKQQTKQKVEERRAEIRREREETRQAQDADSSANPTTHQTPALDSTAEIEIDETEIDVLGWQNKGQWVFALELTTDFLKLVVYSVFFTILLTFYGLPIHILRDVFLTFRSFSKRISDYVKYRQATKDMNERYPDATPEEITREDTCIICREEMQAWAVNPANNAQADGTHPGNAIFDERSRPKKLPCGHILHFGCLRSWLERQQNCPTCRQPVITPNRIRVEVNRAAQAPRLPNQNAAPHHHHHHHEQHHHQNIHQHNDHGPPAQANGNQPRYIRFGPLQLGIAFGRDGAAAVNRNIGLDNPPPPEPQQLDPNAHPNSSVPTHYGHQHFVGSQHVSARFTGQAAIQSHINQLEQLLNQEVNTLRTNAEQLQTIRALQSELNRLQHQSATSMAHEPNAQRGPEGLHGFTGPAFAPPPGFQNFLRPLPHHHHGPTPLPQTGTSNTLPTMNGLPQNNAFRPPPGQRPLTSTDPNLPPGFTLPEGWTLLPLQQNHVRVEPSHQLLAASRQIPIPRSATAPPLEPRAVPPQDARRDGAHTPVIQLPTWQHMASQAEAYQRLMRPEADPSNGRSVNPSSTSQPVNSASPNSHDPVHPSRLRQQNTLPTGSSSLPPIPILRTPHPVDPENHNPQTRTGRRSSTGDHTNSTSESALNDFDATSNDHTANQASSSAINAGSSVQETFEEAQNGAVSAKDKGKARAATVEDDPELD